MLLKTLTLRGFRNYADITIPFSSGINVIEGDNGAGKTNLIEALYLLTTGRSFRTTRLSDLVKKGSKGFCVQAQFQKDNVGQTLSFSFDKTKRVIKHNWKSQKSAAHLLGIFPSVLYAPKDHDLLAGSPKDRRRFLNIQLAQVDPRYAYHLIRYQKALKHRNALLKKKEGKTLPSWEKIMAESGAYLMEKRAYLTNELKPIFHTHLQTLCPKTSPFAFSYQPSLPSSQIDPKSFFLSLLSRFQIDREKELIVGTTLAGPHRDDLFIYYQDEQAKVYSSEGQKRTCITALKMAEWDYLKKHLEGFPLFMIDDFAIHLDAARTEKLCQQLSHFRQVVLTTPACPFSDSHRITITDAKISSLAKV